MTLDIVIVTYNRLDKLKKTLSLYNAQTHLFRTLIVVDNCSTDGTIEYLQEWKQISAKYEKHVIFLPENKGGSGGFYAGEKYAMTLNPDWIYVSDDDAYPYENMIEEFYNYINNNNTKNISAVCSMVYNYDNTIAYDHRANYIIKNMEFIKINSINTDYKKIKFPIKLLSYVGSFLNYKALEVVGLCNPDLFIFYDDTEHSIRLTQYGQIHCVPTIKITHDSGISENTSIRNEILISWREFYYIRNKIHMLIKHHKGAALYLTIQYLYMSFKSLITSLTKDRQYRYIYNLINAAIYGAWINKTGKHPIYQPGYIIRKNGNE